MGGGEQEVLFVGFQVIIGLAFALLGLCLGSFSNVLIYRLSEKKSLFKPKRSFCPTCGNEIKWYDNIPILSYIILKGKCRKCKQKISIRYPIIEAAGLLIGIATFLLNYYTPDFASWGWQFNYKSIFYFFMAIILLNISLIDYKTYEIPYELSIPFWVLCAGLFTTQIVLEPHRWLEFVLGFGCTAVVFVLIYLIPYLIKKVEVIGLGDVILYAVIGLAFGGYQIILVVIISTLVCSIVELIKIKVKGEKTMIAFGPYIAIATVFCMFFGEPIINAYLGLLGIM